jgi:hypothetical protein
MAFRCLEFWFLVSGFWYLVFGFFVCGFLVFLCFVAGVWRFDGFGYDV